MMRRSFWVSITLGLTACLAMPLPGLSAPLSERIQSTRGKLDQSRQREGVLSTTIAAYGTRIERIEGEIGGTVQRLRRVQASLDRKRAELAEIRRDLEAARERLAWLKARLKVAEEALAERLVEIYKADEPDALTVILEADGFADLLERAEFLDRVSDQDQRIVTRVRVLKAAAKREADRLADLEQRAEDAANAIFARRQAIAASMDRLLRSREELAQTRDGRRAILARVRRSRHTLEKDLDALEAESARVQARLQAQPAGAVPPLGPIRRGSGRLIWPVNGPVTGSFGEARPGHMHAGIDISAPTGTPIRAAASGTVTLLGFTGGYGNYTCIGHGGGLSTCYAHQSGYATSSGASVSQGQVIGYVGSTGNSSGPHLHFEVRVGGAPVDPLGYL
jgi:murein DD-endopeptidase MepM/ murein hydrolase activator NlpD